MEGKKGTPCRGQELDTLERLCERVSRELWNAELNGTDFTLQVAQLKATVLGKRDKRKSGNQNWNQKQIQIQFKKNSRLWIRYSEVA